MPYNYSQIDKDNLNWFQKDDSKASLFTIKLYVGHVRSLYNFELNFKYPISVIAGKNGSGKSNINYFFTETELIHRNVRIVGWLLFF